MSDNAAFGFGKFVPGFDFLQSLAKSASQPASPGQAIPGMSSWVAPTLSVEELDKRIQELKAVQFWLEQNGTALKATIQALEVQKMTLTTLQGMNVNMAELAKAFTARAPETPPSAPQSAASAANAAPAAEPSAPPQPQAAAKTAKAAKTTHSPQRSSQAKADAASGHAAVDPMQWWGSLTQQFQNIASSAMQDVAAQAMKAPNADTKAKAASKQAKQAKPAPRAAAKKAAPQKAAPKPRAPRT